MSTTATYQVDGMTCGHCAQSVTEELTALDGVSDVQVELVGGGTSTVTVTSDAPLERDAVAAAVTEAGYALTPPRSLL
ncbi:MAG: heavy-metal-associated domain-containing protein [Actinomycetales bacterium]|nr:heavy-metal-associated domain-containing protein [Actinomycetales bacterium]